MKLNSLKNRKKLYFWLAIIPSLVWGALWLFMAVVIFMAHPDSEGAGVSLLAIGGLIGLYYFFRTNARLPTLSSCEARRAAKILAVLIAIMSVILIQFSDTVEELEIIPASLVLLIFTYLLLEIDLIRIGWWQKGKEAAVEAGETGIAAAEDKTA